MLFRVVAVANPHCSPGARDGIVG